VKLCVEDCELYPRPAEKFHAVSMGWGVFSQYLAESTTHPGSVRLHSEQQRASNTKAFDRQKVAGYGVDGGVRVDADYNIKELFFPCR